MTSAPVRDRLADCYSPPRTGSGEVVPMSDRITPMSMFDYDARPVTPGVVVALVHRRLAEVSGD